MALLAAVQFAHVLDFIVIMPLGPQFMRVFDCGPAAFALMVATYNLAAAIAGFFGAFILDLFDRKRALLTIFAGFILGTFACALSPGLSELTAARIVTGAFGGLMQAVLFTIVGDTFNENRRATAMGTVMSAFSFASIAGVPISLWLADRFDWRTPFLLLTFLGIGTWIGIWRVLPPIISHLSSPVTANGALAAGAARTKSLRDVIRGTWRLATARASLAPFALVVCLMFAGFTVIPFMSAYLVTNLGLQERDLATVFLLAGTATLLTSRMTGRLSDRFGKLKMFLLLSAASTVPVFALTHMGRASVPLVVAVATLFTVLISARAIPAMALITSSVPRVQRGAFLSLTSCVQQGASALASFATGSLLALSAQGSIIGYGFAGEIAVFCTILAMLAARKIRLAA